MNYEIMIFHKGIVDTYLHTIRENFNLICKLSQEKDYREISSLISEEKLLIARAKHIQIMSLVGISAEHLIKLILLKKGYVLNSAKPKKFTPQYINKIKNYNSRTPNQKELDALYAEAYKKAKIDFSERLINFDDCIQLFRKSIEEGYHNELGEWRFDRNIPDYKYFPESRIGGDNCLKIIQRMRNSYLHKAEPQSELQGIFWYMYNYLLWLAKKEFPDFFVELEYIGHKENKCLFTKERE